MTQESYDELGPIDYVVIEWRGSEPNGEAAPLIVDAVDKGIIRILDIAFLAKGEDGSTATLDLGSFAGDDPGLALFDGASSGLLSQADLDDAATVLEPGTIAAVMVWENRFIAPIAAALRRSGAELVANGRIPVTDLIGALDLVEAGN
jgi:uncharacterized protein DUF6325